MSAMREAQLRWDNMLPRDDSAERAADEQASIAAFARYLKTGDLPGREDASHVWDELEDDGGELILFDMLAAYRADNDAELLALAKLVAGRVDNIVNEKIEEGLQWP